MCDRCKRSNEIVVCHRLRSICDRSCKFNYWPLNIRSSNSYQVLTFQNNLRAYFWQISHGFPFLLLWSAGRQCTELILCRVVESLCSPTHNIVPHIPWHGLPCRRTTKKYEDSQRMEAFLFHPQKFAIRTWFCNCPQYLCLCHIVYEYTPGKHDQRKMLVLPNQPLCWVLSTSDQCFVSFQPMKCHPHTQIRITLFHGVRKSIPNWKTFSQPCFDRIFSNCLSP